MNAADKAPLSSRREGVVTPEISSQLLPFCLVCRILAESEAGDRGSALAASCPGNSHSGGLSLLHLTTCLSQGITPLP